MLAQVTGESSMVYSRSGMGPLRRFVEGYRPPEDLRVGVSRPAALGIRAAIRRCRHVVVCRPSASGASFGDEDCKRRA